MNKLWHSHTYATSKINPTMCKVIDGPYKHNAEKWIQVTKKKILLDSICMKFKSRIHKAMLSEVRLDISLGESSDWKGAWQGHWGADNVVSSPGCRLYGHVCLWRSSKQTSVQYYVCNTQMPTLRQATRVHSKKKSSPHPPPKKVQQQGTERKPSLKTPEAEKQGRIPTPMV